MCQLKLLQAKLLRRHLALQSCSDELQCVMIRRILIVCELEMNVRKHHNFGGEGGFVSFQRANFVLARVRLSPLSMTRPSECPRFTTSATV